MIHMLGDLPFDGRLIKHGDQDYELLKSRLRLCESSQGKEREPLHVGEPETSGLDGFRLVDVEKQYVVRAQLSKTKQIALGYVWGRTRQLPALKRQYRRALTGKGLKS